ncbi:programmed cell death protein 1-like [Polyodon spathula]|uniref:programmed cell death protein 1-like n=1 Tax=Polyodon spathula TaxID=7913 RepID=UPI001B7F5820|nr:programmed cell death protein 1-like [Polyodon spathula]
MRNHAANHSPLVPGTSSPQLDRIKRQQERRPSQAVPVYSIEYGVLEFPRRDALPPATMPDQDDHVEYATITFPAGQEEGSGGKHCWSHCR